MDYRGLAERCLEKRSEIFEKRKKAEKAGKRDLCAEYDSQMDSLAAEAREYVEFAEHQNEIRGAMAGAGALGRPGIDSADAEGEWRGLLPGHSELAEARAENNSGVLVPKGTAAKYVDLLRANTVFLDGIPAENLIPFNERDWTMPILSDSDMPALVQENALITEGDDDWVELEFNSKAYKDLRGASNELFADSAVNLRNVLAQTLLKNVAVQWDYDAFNGDGTTTPVLGLISQGVPTEVGSAGGDTATFDDIADAIGRLWTANAKPSVLWLSPDAAIALSKERESTEGAYLADADSAVGLARRLPQKISTNIPAGHVVVADGSRVFAGIREDATVDVSEHAEFKNDRTLVRLRMRAAGVYVVESSSVQVLTPNDGV